MAAISLDTDQARQTAGTFTSCAGSFGSELNALKSAAESVMSTWNGNSKTQFEGQWQEWCGHLQRLIDELENLSHGLKLEAQEFDQVAQRFG